MSAAQKPIVDGRSYVAKFLSDGTPIMVALSDSDQKDRQVKFSLLEIWEEQKESKKKLALVEVQYSHQKASEIMKSVSEMAGPDMFQLQHMENGQIVACIWQRVINVAKERLMNLVDLDIYDLETGTKQIKHIHSKHPNEMTNDELIKHIRQYASLPTLARPVASHQNNMAFFIK